MSKPSTTAAAARAAANPFGKCLYFTANAVAREVNRIADEALAPSGLCPSGALLLSLVVDRPGLGPSEAAEVLHLAPSSITRFADGLERKGLIERRTQGRQSMLHATPQGVERRSQVLACWETLHARYSAAVGETKGASVASDLARMAELLGEARS